MEKAVSLRDVVDTMDSAGDGMTGYIHVKTGELASLTDEEMSLAEEFDALPDDYPDWQEDGYLLARRVLADDDFVGLPDQYSINEYSIMERFCDTVDDKHIREKLFLAIAGRGAFRRFKDTVAGDGIREEWFDFKNRAFEKIAVDFLESLNIPYHVS